MENIDLSKNWGIVAYPDGGARPNPGASGTGVFGYLYDIDQTTEKAKPSRFTVGDLSVYSMPTTAGYRYTDKDGKFSSSKDKERKPVIPVHYFEMAMSSSGTLSNNHAELNGAYQIFLVALAVKAKRLFMSPDAMYVIDGLTRWCQGWVNNGWKTREGEPISNSDLWQATYAKFTELKESGCAIGIEHIKGHAGHPGNIHADNAATIGVFKSRDGIDDPGLTFYTAKEFWEPKKDRHPLMALKRIYFDRLGDNYVPGKYFMADPGKDDALIGKPLPETVYAIVKLNEPKPVITSVIKKQHRYGQDFNEVVMIRVENLYVNETYRLLKTHGEYCMKKTDRGTSVDLVDNKALTVERKPVGITMRAIDSLNSLDAIFDKYESRRADPEEFEKSNPSLFQVHDITSEFYDIVEKKVGKEVKLTKALKKDFGVGHKDHKVTLNFRNAEGPDTERAILLKLALDLPERNILKQLESLDVTLELITWRESELSVRYATIVRCCDGSALWSNFYADRLIFKK